MSRESNHIQVNFLDLNVTGRANAIKQMAEVNQQEHLYEASTAEELVNMIVDGYNPDRDFMFLQYPDDSADKVTVYLKDFS